MHLGSRSFSAFFVELGALMIVASTIVPDFNSNPGFSSRSLTSAKYTRSICSGGIGRRPLPAFG